MTDWLIHDDACHPIVHTCPDKTTQLTKSQTRWNYWFSGKPKALVHFLFDPHLVHLFLRWANYLNTCILLWITAINVITISRYCQVYCCSFCTLNYIYLNCLSGQTWTTVCLCNVSFAVSTAHHQWRFCLTSWKRFKYKKFESLYLYYVLHATLLPKATFRAITLLRINNLTLGTNCRYSQFAYSWGSSSSVEA